MGRSPRFLQGLPLYLDSAATAKRGPREPDLARLPGKDKRGVQRGEAPLRFFYPPRLGDKRGLEEDSPEVLRILVGVGVRVKSIVIPCVLPERGGGTLGAEGGRGHIRS